jgi:CO/xanthine dehydrogenase FAD-binding subunit
VKPFTVEQPTTIAAALELMCAVSALQVAGEKVWLAGGQSLLAAMKVGMTEPGLLIDLQGIAALKRLELSPAADVLRLGAMVTHARVADSKVIHSFCPGLAALAGGIADQQVRNMGTIGGSLANNDPAACWPAAALALKARLVTSERSLSADDFFTSVFTTALNEAELLTQVDFPQPIAFKYLKFEQPASRFALLGLAVARFESEVRVAITGLGHGVRRWPQAEQALTTRFSVEVLEHSLLPVDWALSDLHASAEYRAHLAGVLCRRAVASITGELLVFRPKIDSSPLHRDANPGRTNQELVDETDPGKSASNEDVPNQSRLSRLWGRILSMIRGSSGNSHDQ